MRVLPLAPLNNTHKKWCWFQYCEESIGETLMQTIKHVLRQSVQVIEQNPKNLALKLKQIGDTTCVRTAASKSLFSSAASSCVVPGYTEKMNKNLMVLVINVIGNKNIASFINKTESEFLRKVT